MSVLSASYSPDTHVPSLKGKVIIITGANGGLGYETAIHLARHSPSKLVLCARSKEKYDNALKGIVVAIPEAVHFVQYLELDLASLSSVQEAAKAFMTDNDRLDILMNNAGIMAQPAALTKNGFEIQFGTNHIVGATLEKTHQHANIPDITAGSCSFYEAPASIAHKNSQWNRLRRPDRKHLQRRPHARPSVGWFLTRGMLDRHVQLFNLDKVWPI